jgi:tetratricopeptide (TPR) repeat protein
MNIQYLTIAENENHKDYECFKAGEIDDAILHFHRAIETLEVGKNECFGASVQYNLSACLIHLGIYNKDAEYHCNLALEADPSGVRTTKLLYKKFWSCLGKLAYREGMFGDAMSHFEMALELEPNNVQMLNLLSTSTTMSGIKFENAFDFAEDDFLDDNFFRTMNLMTMILMTMVNRRMHNHHRSAKRMGNGY